ncbi:MAG: B-box zinc finger protein [Lentisphaeria bacterium]|nr:B-box zinc finger protein [Lentisphaeria bacterium]
MANCLNHPDREAVIHCAACGKPVCSGCVVQASYCSDICAERGKAAAARACGVIDERRRTRKSALPKRIALVIILLAIAGTLYWYYSNNKKQIDRKARSIVNSVDRKNRDAIRSNQYRAPDSKFKRDRENLVR